MRRPAAALLVAVALAACTGETAPFDPSAPPDILLITVDTLRADRLGCYGHAAAETPTFDRLAAEGTLYLEAITPLPRTTPALASILTGLPPHRHGSTEVGQPIAAGTLISELLAQAGYSTLGISANGAAGRRHHLDSGFAQFIVAEELATRRAGEVTERALALIADAPPDAPLFLWAHYVDPHAPYEPPEPWASGPRGNLCRQMLAELERRGWQAGHAFSDRDGLSSAALPSCSWLYDGEIAATDAAIGRLLDGVDRLRDRGVPVVIVTADHGENLGEDGLFYQHGPNVHDASLKVPLIVAGPGLRTGAVDTGPVTLEDLAPTILTLAGVPAEGWPAMAGLDLAPRLVSDGGGAGLEKTRTDERALRILFAQSGSALMLHNSLALRSGRADGRHCVNGERFSLCRDASDAPGGEPTLHDRTADPLLSEDVSAAHPDELQRLLAASALWPPEQARERTVRTPRFKLVERPLLDGGYKRALYDLVDDPAATVDVSAEHPEVAARLATLLDRWVAALPRAAPAPRSPEQLKALRALGYLD